MESIDKLILGAIVALIVLTGFVSTLNYLNENKCYETCTYNLAPNVLTQCICLCDNRPSKCKLNGEKE